MKLEEGNNPLIFRIIDANDQIGLSQINQLAYSIWTEHYSPIIGIEQVNYMLEKFQSEEAMSTQIKEGYCYYLIERSEKPVGYFSFQKREKKLFLSKVYLNKDQRGKGFFSKVINYIEIIARKLDCLDIELTVNKNNSNSIEIYLSKGFIKIADAVFDIGHGYIMDDYVLQKHI